MTGLAMTSTVVTGLSANKTYRFVVKARNAIGYSLVSQITSIKTLPEFVGEKPSAPINLQNDPTKTNADQIGLIWDSPLLDGGFPVIDYRLWMQNKKDGSEFTLLAENVVETSYVATNLQ